MKRLNECVPSLWSHAQYSACSPMIRCTIVYSANKPIQASSSSWSISMSLKSGRYIANVKMVNTTLLTRSLV